MHHDASTFPVTGLVETAGGESRIGFPGATSSASAGKVTAASVWSLNR
jgi:hypothetical protein